METRRPHRYQKWSDELQYFNSLYVPRKYQICLSEEEVEGPAAGKQEYRRLRAATEKSDSKALDRLRDPSAHELLAEDTCQIG